MRPLAETFQNNSDTPPGENQAGFGKAVLLMLFTIVAGIVAQHASQLRSDGGISVAGIAITIGIMIIFLILVFRYFRRLISTPYFAITSLLGLAIATAIGTFIAQNLPQEAFVQRYGTFSSLLNSLHLGDIFHSWWYAGIFVLLAISLISISLKRPLNKRQLGFHLAHLSPIVILFGFWMDYYSGFRGLIQLLKGKSTNEISVYHRNTNSVAGKSTLDFSIRLDEFATEKFEPDYKIQIWRRNAARHSQRHPDGKTMGSVSKLVTTIPLDTGKTHRVFGTDITFELKEVYRDIDFTYSHPPYDSAAVPKDPGLIIDINSFLGRQTVQLRANNPNQNSINDPHFGAILEYYWEIPDSVHASLYSLSNARKGSNWIIIEGKSAKVVRVTGEDITTEPITLNQFYAFTEGQLDNGFIVTHIFPDAALLKATPRNKSDKWLNPIAKVNIRRTTWTNPRNAYLVPTRNKKSGYYTIPDSDFLLALESMKDQETKYWRSKVTVLDSDGNAVKSQDIVVNEPMYYNGYRFYQTDYDPNNPNYSGIGVSRTPGLYIVYAGFYLLVAGIVLMFYYRTTYHGPHALPDLIESHD